jgi:hypothetical protein
MNCPRASTSTGTRPGAEGESFDSSSSFFYEERAEFKIVLFSKFENILIFDPISTLLILTRTVWTEIRAANCSTLKIYFSKSVLFFVSDLEFIFLYFCFLYFNIVETE